MTRKSVPPTESAPDLPKHFLLWNLFFSAAAVIIAFLTLTAGIPLIQAGILPVFGSKKGVYARVVTIPFLVFAGLLILFSKWRPEIFRRLWIVQTAQSIVETLRFRYAIPVLALLYLVTVLLADIVRQYVLETRAFDLGIFAQAVWNTLQGNFLFSSLKGGICLLGDHVSPILVVAVPFYAVFKTPLTLIVLQALAAASAFIFITLLAQKTLKDRWITWSFLLMYFFYFPVKSSLREDFHPEILAEPFMYLAFLFLEARKLFLFSICLVVIALGKENFLGITFFFGLYAAFFRGHKKLGGAIMISSIAFFLFETSWLVPHLNPDGYLYKGSYLTLAGKGAGVWKTILLDPDRWEYLFKVLSTFLFLPLFHFPTLLLALPILAQNFLSDNSVMRSLNYHYLMGLTPFLFIATIYGFQSLAKKFVWIGKYPKLLALALLIMAVCRSGPPEYYYFWQSLRHNTPHERMVRQETAKIPEEASVLTHNNVIPQLANREHIYQFDYNATPTKEALARQLQVEYVILNRNSWEPNSAPLEQTLAGLKAAGYTPVFSKNDFYILNRPSRSNEKGTRT